jgi:hypothetical protein
MKRGSYMKHKKIIVMILACVLFFTSFSTKAYAYEPTSTSVAWNFTVLGGNLVLSSTICLTDFEVMMYGCDNHYGSPVNIYIERMNTMTGEWYLYRTFVASTTGGSGSGTTSEFTSGYYRIFVSGSAWQSSSGVAYLKPLY